jgi:hypothetical protein
MGMPVRYENIYHAQSHCLIFRSSWTLASPPVLLVIGDDDPDDLPSVQEEGPPSSNFHLFVSFPTLRKFSIAQYLSPTLKAYDLEPALHLNVAFMGKSVSIYIVSTNTASFGTTHDLKRLKVAWRGSSALQLLELIVPYPWHSSLIHLQRCHRTKQSESPLLAKEGTFLSKEFG